MTNYIVKTFTMYKTYFTFAFYSLIGYIIIYNNNDIIFKHKKSDNELNIDKPDHIGIDIDISKSKNTFDELHWGQFEDIEKNN